MSNGTYQLQEYCRIMGIDSKLRTLQHARVFREDAVVGVQLQLTLDQQVDDAGACAMRRQDGGDEHVGVQHHSHSREALPCRVWATMASI